MLTVKSVVDVTNAFLPTQTARERVTSWRKGRPAHTSHALGIMVKSSHKHLGRACGCNSNTNRLDRHNRVCLR